MIKVILKDGSTMEIEEGTSILEVAKKYLVKIYLMKII